MYRYNKIFLKKLWKKSVVRIVTFLLAPFVSKLVNNLRHGESLNIRKISEIDDIFLRWQRFVGFQTYFKDSLSVPRIIDRLGCKRCQKKRKDVDYKLFYKNFCTWTVGCQIFVQYIGTYVVLRTVYFGWICRFCAHNMHISKIVGASKFWN